MSSFQDLVNLYEQATAPNPVSYGRITYPVHGLENEEEGEEGSKQIKKDLLIKIAENPYRSHSLALKYVDKKRPVPTPLLKSVLTQAALASDLADQHILKKMKVPKILQNRVKFFNTVDLKKLGDLEIERPDGEIDHWELFRKPYIYLVGTSSNTGMLPMFYLEPETDENEQQVLDEIQQDLEVLARDGKNAMSRLKAVSDSPHAGFYAQRKYEYNS